MAVTVTVQSLVLNTLTPKAADVATVDSANGTEVFTVPVGKTGQTLIAINNGAGHGALTFSIAKGVTGGGAGAALTGSVADGVTSYLQLDTARYATAAGTLLITLTPASGKKLKTEHVASVQGIELA
jgi:hypothetical protein